jgi:membrane protease YdiL (CAAX protease family)
MTTKRLILAVLTVISLIPFFLSLFGSLNEAQIQSNLELSQTNLLLDATEIQNDLGELSQDLSTEQIESLEKLLLGNEPYNIAEKQYVGVQTSIQKNIDQLNNQLTKAASLVGLKEDNSVDFKLIQKNASQETLIKKSITKVRTNLYETDLKIGLIKARQNKISEAQQIWEKLINLESVDGQLNKIQKTAKILKALWSNPAIADKNAELILTENLNGWFRYQALDRFYEITNQTEAKSQLEKQQTVTATQAILKLLAISTLPLLGGLLGVGLLVFLFLQLLIKKEEAILAHFYQKPWETPWDWEIIWQVLIVGFFFLGQIALPLLLGFIQFDASALTLRGKAYYVLASYAAMTAGGLLVLYLSLKSFFPLPQDWFRFNLGDRWFLWGIGGYLVALPLVVIVSLINQEFWQGQGGSNPLLFLALEAQDKVVLAIFFFTASIAAPFFEEIMFRGFLLPSLTRYVPVWTAICLSSLLFAIAHLNLSEVLPLAMLGIILGVVYTRSRNLLASMLLHSLWNSGTLISLFILGS